MTFPVVLQFALLLKSGVAQLAGVRLVFGVRPPDVAVVRGVRGEGLPAVFALEGPLAGVLPDVRPQDAGGSEGLEEGGREAEGRQQPETRLDLLFYLFIFRPLKRDLASFV